MSGNKCLRSVWKNFVTENCVLLTFSFGATQLVILLYPFNSLFSGTTWVSWYQKGKTSLDLNEARDDGVLGWTICKQSAPRCRQITTPVPHHSIFTGWMLFLMPKQWYQSSEDQCYTSVWNTCVALKNFAAYWVAWMTYAWVDDTGISQRLYSSQPDIKLIVVLLVADTDQHGILLSDPVWQTDPADRIWSSSCRWATGCDHECLTLVTLVCS